MREVVLQVWCDRCEALLPEDEAIHIEIVLDNPRSQWEMDLCAKHADELLQDARPDGKPKSTKTSDRAHPCDQCSFSAKTPGGLELHKTRKHGNETEGKPE
jgi:hypothetical protein